MTMVTNPTNQDIENLPLPLTLTALQTQSLAQLRELTNGADDEVCIGVLSSVGWDVQKATELIFGSHTGGSGPDTASTSTSIPSAYRYPPASASSLASASASASASGSGSASSSSFSGSERERRGGWEAIDVNDEGQQQPGRRVGAGGPIRAIPRTLLTLLTLPLHIISGLLRFLLMTLLRVPPRFFRLPLLRNVVGGGGGPAVAVPRVTVGSVGLGSLLGYVFGSNNNNGGRGNGVGGGGPERWIRELEEETGGVCLRRRTASALGVGLSEGKKRRNVNGLGLEFDEVGIIVGGGGRKYLPDFEVCTYEEMLKKCRREMRVGCVVLVSEEHDDVREFKMGTLMDAGLVKVLSDNEIIVWGGDVRDREAWSASEKLQATTYPFVAFIALQPRRNPGLSSSSSSSTSAPTLTVLSRHQGPSTDSGPTSALTLKAHVEGTVLPRVMPYLRGLVEMQKERDRDRELRAEQDRAFEEAKRKDKERIERRMNEERERVAEREEEERKKDEERREREKRAGVRRWTRKWLKEKKKKGGVRIGIRLPTGKRLIETVETLTGLYAFVDAQFVDEDDDDNAVVEGIDNEEALERYVEAQEGAYWEFKISTVYPRKEIVWKPGTRLEDLPELGAGGQVVVERHLTDEHSDSE